MAGCTRRHVTTAVPRKAELQSAGVGADCVAGPACRRFDSGGAALALCGSWPLFMAGAGAARVQQLAGEALSRRLAAAASRLKTKHRWRARVNEPPERT